MRLAAVSALGQSISYELPPLVSQRNFALTLENNKLLIEQSHLHSIKKRMFVARSCTKWVYLIFAINRADLKHHLRNNPMKEMILQNSPYERSVLSNKKAPHI